VRNGGSCVCLVDGQEVMFTIERRDALDANGAQHEGALTTFGVGGRPEDDCMLVHEVALAIRSGR